MTSWEWPRSRIIRVIDGDTIDASVTRDLGFGGSVTFPIRLRLNRINAAPIKTTKGKAAANRVTQLVMGVDVDITTVGAYKYGGPDNMTGEWMAEVVLPDGRNVSDILLAEGLVVAWSGDGPRPDGR